MESYKRVNLAQNETFQYRLLILFIDYAHDVMNIQKEDDNVAKLQAKAQELLNQPDSFKQRLAFSVAAKLPDDFLDIYVTDESIQEIVPDVFDAIAGVRTVV